MGLLDSLVDRSFRDEKAGRVVVFTGTPRNRGYLVRSRSEEVKITSFLKMFYFAHVSILLLGAMLANSWSTFFARAFFDRPAAHMVGVTGIALATFLLVMGLPYFLLWRSYEKALLSFASAEYEVVLSETSAKKPPWTAAIPLGVVALIFAGVCALIALK